MGKKIIILITGLLLFGSAYAQPFKGRIEIFCDTIEQRNDMLHVDLSVYVAARAVNTTQSLSLVPFIYADENSQQIMPSVLVNGNNKRQMFERRSKFRNADLENNRPDVVINIDSRSDTTLRYVADIPYQPWMDSASLKVVQLLTSCRGQQQLFVLTLSENVFNEDPAVTLQPHVVFVTPKREVKKQRVLEEKAYLDFHVGKSDIIANFRNNGTELDKIHNSISALTNNSDIEIKNINIVGYASPEGSASSNLALSSRRAEALKNYIAAKYSIPLSVIYSRGEGEDWNGLRELVQQGNLAFKYDILSIIDSYADLDTKEARMKVVASGAPYSSIYSEIYPKLRRVEYRIEYDVKEYAADELADAAEKDMSLLSHYELFSFASRYEPGSDKFNEIFEYILHTYPENEAAIVNASSCLILEGRYDEAGEVLRSSQLSAEALNNLGIVAFHNGNTEEAMAYFMRSAEMNCFQAGDNIDQVRCLTQSRW